MASNLYNIKYLFWINISTIFRNLNGIIRAKLTSILLGVTGVGILGQIITFFSVQCRFVMIGTDTILVNRLGKLKINSDKEQFNQVIFLTYLILLIINIIYIILILIFFKSLFYLIIKMS